MVVYIIEMVPTEQHPVVTDTQWIQISFIRILHIIQHLGSHIEGWAKHSLGQYFRSKHFAEPKISYFGHTIMSKYVGQFEISMQYFIFVEMMESIDDLT